MKLDLTKILLNYIIPILIVAIIYLLYKYYIKLFINVKEHFSNKTILCDDNSCGKGCQTPDKINDSCPTTIYKDVDGNCHRKCPYVCPDKSDKCKHDECCVGCGYKKMAVPCDLANEEEDETNDEDDKKKDNDEPSPNKDKNTTANPNTKTDSLTTTDVNHKDSFYKDWSPYVRKWPCGMNVTGTFTECGPDAYNNCGK
jgi:hypothetical protein